jgi:hypothetical protein
LASHARRTADAPAVVDNRVPAHEVWLKYSLYGDANLDNTVNVTDLIQFLINYGQTGLDWTQGDFNYDGACNITDLLLYLNNDGPDSGGSPDVKLKRHRRVEPDVSGPAVTYTLSLNDNGSGTYSPGHYAIYASDSTSDGNAGISGFGVAVNSDWSTITNVSPKGIYDDGLGDGGTDELGFTLARTGSGKDPIGASQDGPEVNGNMVAVYGFGQSSGNLNSDAPPGSTGHSGLMQGTYGANLLVSIGTFSGSLEFAGSNNSADVWVSTGSVSTEAATIVFVTQTLT